MEIAKLAIAGNIAVRHESAVAFVTGACAYRFSLANLASSSWLVVSSVICIEDATASCGPRKDFIESIEDCRSLAVCGIGGSHNECTKSRVDLYIKK